jgi:hypothetical protein
MKYHWNHFSGTDWNDKTRTKAIYKILGKNKNGWTTDVDDELGNYDYLYGGHQLRVCEEAENYLGCSPMSTSLNLR